MDLLNLFSFCEQCLAWLTDSQNVLGVPASAGMLTWFWELPQSPIPVAQGKCFKSPVGKIPQVNGSIISVSGYMVGLILIVVSFSHGWSLFIQTVNTLYGSVCTNVCVK